MKLARFAFRSINNIKSNPFYGSSIITRSFSADAIRGHENRYNQHNNNVEPGDEYDSFVRGNNTGSSSFYQKLDKVDRGGNQMGPEWWTLSGINRHEDGDSSDDEVDGKLRNAASNYFDFNDEEVESDNYSFRPDSNFPWGSTYDIKDLDLRRPGVQRVRKRYEFKVTTKEVLQKADFRNVRFLANFITEAGIIIKRSQTGISAKAQRKVAREIKTARAFGLMPFTCMGTKSFVYGRSMEDREEDFEYEVNNNPDNPEVDDYPDNPEDAVVE